MVSLVNPDRHLEYFNPDHTRNRQHYVIGCGTVGKCMAEGLAALGVDPALLHLVDPQVIEPENVGPQKWNLDEVGAYKAERLAMRIEKMAGTRPYVHLARFTGKQVLSGYVFLCLDSIEDRLAIWHGSVKNNGAVVMMFDIGIGDVDGKCYCVRPSHEHHQARYEELRNLDLERSEKAILEPGCGRKQTVRPTAEIAVGIAQWQYMKWIAKENGHDDPFENVVGFAMRGLCETANESWD